MTTLESINLTDPINLKAKNVIRKYQVVSDSWEKKGKASLLVNMGPLCRGCHGLSDYLGVPKTPFQEGVLTFSLSLPVISLEHKSALEGKRCKKKVENTGHEKPRGQT